MNQLEGPIWLTCIRSTGQGPLLAVGDWSFEKNDNSRMSVLNYSYKVLDIKDCDDLKKPWPRIDLKFIYAEICQ